MTRLFSCPNGHRWEATVSTPKSDDGSEICPQCGSCGETIVVSEDERTDPFAAADKLPPPPKPLDARPQDVATEAFNSDTVQTEAGKTTPEIPGFECLDQLGRGGMGTVYKARHLRLDRIVAVKTITEARATDPELIERFHKEAKAVAQLNHPHVAQIYEFGQAQDVPYFAMEYLEGGTLAQKIKASPPSVQDAAQIVQTLARAVEYAHAKGVIHRDLKPANVLLAADGTPKITDFGLAKRLDYDADQTRTGIAMGTPSYMPPEQAEARAAEVGTGSDVYSLGAVLYDVLTGRPPFRGESVIETLRQLAEKEPVSPRLLNPKVPRDLETICLKCLEKDPRRRYATAAALAEELRRFRLGEPIQARPIGNVQRVWRWCRRNPRAAVLATTAAFFFLLALVASSAGYVTTSAALTTSRASETRAKESEAQAQKNYLDALDAVNEFYGLVGGDMELASPRAMLPQRAQLLRRGVDYYRRLLETSNNLPEPGSDGQTSPRLREKIGDSWNTYGQVLFHLGDKDKAYSAFAAAIRFREQPAARNPQNATHQRKLANSYMNIGILDFENQEFQSSRQRFEAAQRLRGPLLTSGNDAAAKRGFAMGLYNLAKVSLTIGDVDRAREDAQQAADRFAELADAPANRAHDHYRLALCYEVLGDLESGVDEALTSYEAARNHLEPIVREHPGVAEYRLELARICVRLGELRFEHGQIEDSLALLRRAEAILQELADEVPDSEAYRALLLGTRRSIELVQPHLGQDD